MATYTNEPLYSYYLPEKPGKNDVLKLCSMCGYFYFFVLVNGQKIEPFVGAGNSCIHCGKRGRYFLIGNPDNRPKILELRDEEIVRKEEESKKKK